MADRAALGRWGEQIAVGHLVGLGMQVLDRNWRCRYGELDVVALDTDSTVVFVEVKTRQTNRFGEPSEAVNYAKAMRIRRLALLWLAEQHRYGDLRFDVVSVVKAPGLLAAVTHLRAAF